ncbi:mediator of RNA polymerase II transcription subunit 9 isoform X2 [Macadamia integrifolia]|uniref:mediator of RNA polymerase II transcription subunit 9 isoform X2 n=1 Tax=Macadamia integrifolia TaxID=60698 RepID=UPI001C4F1976|nr:mediator of RNA polymerase II transcription subunit 9 isoform X2 [Macadamia integrifolia]
MEHPYSGGSWMMIPSSSTPNTAGATSNQDLSLLHQHHLHHQQQQQQQQLQQQQQQQQQRHQQQHHQHQSLASHFHLLHLVENLADAIESGTRDQHSDTVSDLTGHFEKCQQILNSISGSINAKAMLKGRSVNWRKLSNCYTKEGI